MACDRKEIVLTRRLEGAKAAAEGKQPSQCPHRGEDVFQWMQGFVGNRGTVEDCQFALDSYLEKRQYYTNRFKEGL